VTAQLKLEFVSRWHESWNAVASERDATLLESAQNRISDDGVNEDVEQGWGEDFSVLGRVERPKCLRDTHTHTHKKTTLVEW
jgi:hypothetical protein